MAERGSTVKSPAFKACWLRRLLWKPAAPNWQARWRTGCSSAFPGNSRFLVDCSGLNTKATGGWDEQGHPFYAAGVTYREQFKVGKPDEQYRVALPKWLGSVAKVSVNRKHAGYIDAPPWECDVNKQIKRGDEDVEVTVTGTLKNTLGPHHGNPCLGSAWPGMFQRGPNPGPPPGEAYSTLGYGLFEPFVLKQVR